MKTVKFRELAIEMAKAGESQTDLSKYLGISKPSLSRRFSGEIKWGEKEKLKLSKHYKRKKEDLFKED